MLQLTARDADLWTSWIAGSVWIDDHDAIAARPHLGYWRSCADRTP
jgi:hypothetical protein